MLIDFPMHISAINNQAIRVLFFSVCNKHFLIYTQREIFVLSVHALWLTVADMMPALKQKKTSEEYEIPVVFIHNQKRTYN